MGVCGVQCLHLSFFFFSSFHHVAFWCDEARMERVHSCQLFLVFNPFACFIHRELAFREPANRGGEMLHLISLLSSGGALLCEAADESDVVHGLITTMHAKSQWIPQCH